METVLRPYKHPFNSTGGLYIFTIVGNSSADANACMHDSQRLSSPLFIREIQYVYWNSAAEEMEMIAGDICYPRDLVALGSKYVYSLIFPVAYRYNLMQSAMTGNIKYR